MMEETLVVIVRAFITFFTLLLFTRLLGKQQMGQLTFFDYITGITIGSIAGSLTTDLETRAWIHWVGLAVFVALTFLFQYLNIKSRYFSKIVDGQPVIVMRGGKILENHLKETRISKDELLMMLRQKDIFDLRQVAYAIIERDGQLSVLPKAEYQPVTPQDLHIPVKPAGMIVELVMDGKVLRQNLAQFHKDDNWLTQQLKAQGIEDVKELSFAGISTDGQLYIDRFEDHVEGTETGDYPQRF